MDKIIKIDEKLLAEYLDKWFNQTDTTKDHFWNRNKTGKVIKRHLGILGKWKNKGRGNPRKGYLGYLKSKQQNNDGW